jgi:hypothetical protein
MRRRERSADLGDDIRELIAWVGLWPESMRRVFTLRKVYALHPRAIARLLQLSDAEVERHLIAAAQACGRHFPEPQAPLTVIHPPNGTHPRSGQVLDADHCDPDQPTDPP